MWVQHLSKQLKDYAESNKFELEPLSRNDAITWAALSWKNLGSMVIKNGLIRQTKNNQDKDPQNSVVEQLERLNAVEEIVSDSDDVVDHYIDETAE